MGPFTQTGQLTRLALRRDWWRLLLWGVSLVGLMMAVAAKFATIYGTPAEIAGITQALKTPAIVALFGPFRLGTHATTAQVFANEMLLFMALIQVVMSISLGIHATRHEEDTGITELLRAHAIGSLAPLQAAVIELTLINLSIGILDALGLSLAGLPGATWLGNWVIGLGLAASGWVFGMLALLSAQLADHATSATGLAYALFGLSYLVRMLTDVQAPRYTWLSPLGWVEKLAPYQQPRLLPLILFGGLGLLCLGSASVWAQCRDLGAGILTIRAGRATAARALRGPITLLWRQEYRVIMGWVLGITVLGAAYGAVFDTIGDILKTNPTMQQVFGTNALHAANHQLILTYSSTIALVLTAVASIPGLQLIFKLYHDDLSGWLDALYARPVSRQRLLLGYTGSAVTTSCLVFLGGWSGLVLVGNFSLTHAADGLTWSEFLTGVAGSVPVMALLLGLGALVVGAWPQGRLVVWGYLAYAFISQYRGNLLQLPHWAKSLGVFDWLPTVPDHAINWVTVSWELGLAISCGLIGLGSYVRRNLQSR
ncbi:permease [Levilactobacillus suantsaii]|uniref:ABC transporter permease n=1 Tax=Levilactobacillus suantsaii TaxID=2292255 RepID=UPI0015F53462|nr:permease [Levilactobacillus suantsaii]QMU08502.1 permease [Levilactobacillus suantsaii]